jgi:hypothetical protein
MTTLELTKTTDGWEARFVLWSNGHRFTLLKAHGTTRRMAQLAVTKAARHRCAWHAQRQNLGVRKDWQADSCQWDACPIHAKEQAADQAACA